MPTITDFLLPVLALVACERAVALAHRIERGARLYEPRRPVDVEWTGTTFTLTEQ